MENVSDHKRHWRIVTFCSVHCDFLFFSGDSYLLTYIYHFDI